MCTCMHLALYSLWQMALYSLWQMREWSCTPHAATCEAGTCVLTHFDLWHRALATTQDTERLML